jgi:nucleoid-associated protein YgaU
MTTRQTRTQPGTQRGMFLLFVVGLFMLQIAFAFTIHGDIGPQSPLVPGQERAAPPVLVGRIDSLITPPTMQKPVHPLPEAALAPAARPTLFPKHGALTAKAATPAPTPGPDLQDTGSHYLTYLVKPGDTLESISKKLFGSTRMVTSLVRLNRIQDERTLRLGQALRVPRTGLKVSSHQ